MAGRINRRQFNKALIGAAAAALAPFNIARAQSNKLKVGVLLPKSGLQGLIGQSCQKGADLAPVVIRDLLGIDIELMNADTETNVDTARTRAEKLIQEGAHCLVGAFDSGQPCSFGDFFNSNQPVMDCIRRQCRSNRLSSFQGRVSNRPDDWNVLLQYRSHSSHHLLLYSRCLRRRWECFGSKQRHCRNIPSGVVATGVSPSQINLSWTASTDNVGVVGYRVFRDTVQVATSTATSYVNPGLAASTTYTYTVAAFDAAGNVSGQSSPAAATTQALDTTPPTLSLTSPVAGAVSGAVVVSAAASDNVAVTGVQFKLDGANLQAEDTTSPYSISWDTTTSANGPHAITAVARDAAANTATSVAVPVTVSNTNPNDPSTLNPTTCSLSPYFLIALWTRGNSSMQTCQVTLQTSTSSTFPL